MPPNERGPGVRPDPEDNPMSTHNANACRTCDPTVFIFVPEFAWRAWACQHGHTLSGRLHRCGKAYDMAWFERHGDPFETS